MTKDRFWISHRAAMYLQAIVPAALLCVLLGCAAMHKPVPPPLEPGEQEHLAVAILADQTDGAAPLTVHFNSETFEREDITEFHWDLGDGSTSTNKSCKHTYTKPGDYTVTLKAVSATGFSDSDWQTITVEGPDDESDD